MSTTAQFKSFGPFEHNGELVTAPRVYHYAAGTTTEKTAWTSRTKSVTAAHPLIGDANGIASAYFEGVYKIQVRMADDATVLFTWDNFDITEGIHRLASSTLIDEIEMEADELYTSPLIPLTGAAFGDKILVAAPTGQSLQGIICNGYVAAADTVQFNLYNLTGDVTTLAEGTWTFLVLEA